MWNCTWSEPLRFLNLTVVITSGPVLLDIRILEKSKRIFWILITVLLVRYKDFPKFIPVNWRRFTWSHWGPNVPFTEWCYIEPQSMTLTHRKKHQLDEPYEEKKKHLLFTWLIGNPLAKTIAPTGVSIGATSHSTYIILR